MANTNPTTSSKTSAYNGSKIARKKKKKLRLYRPITKYTGPQYERLRAKEQG